MISSFWQSFKNTSRVLIARVLMARVGLGLLTSSLLVACPPAHEYSLSTIIPSVVTPGDQVSAFGDFPPNTSVMVGSTRVDAVQGSGSLMFKVPVTQLAGDAPVSLEAVGVKLPGSLSVNPRLDAVAINAGVVSLSGLGWSNLEISNIRVLLDGFEITPKLGSVNANNTSSSLEFSLPSGVSYGSFALSVRVADRTSNTLRLAREAGSASGIVILPAFTSSSVSSLRSMVFPRATPSPSRVFTVFHQNPLPQLELVGLTKTLEIPVLHATQLSFDSLENAQTAFTELSQQSNLKLEWASTLTSSQARDTNGVQALRGTGVPAPVSPGAGQWHLALEGIPNAWKQSQGEGITVAVVDTGVLLEHPDLKANFLPGYDFVDLDAIPEDNSFGHGTHVAGLVAANGLALGVAPKAKILPVRVLNADVGMDSAVALGILWSANLLPDLPNPNPAQVINLSLGQDDFSSLIAQAVARVQALGVIVVAAAGNKGYSALSYPAALPGVISVTALAGPKTAYQPGYAQSGAGLWLTAYGGDNRSDQNTDNIPDGVLSTNINLSSDPTKIGGYAVWDGTSFACPQVAGLAALALSSGTTPELIRDQLAANSSDLGIKGYDSRFGFGLISGRSATPSNPRAYVIALDAGKIISFGLVQPSGSFKLENLPPGKTLELRAVTDPNGNGILGEAGEQISVPRAFRASDGQDSSLEPFTLNPSDGLQTFKLQLNP